MFDATLEKIKKITNKIRRDKESAFVMGTQEQLADVRSMLNADGYECDDAVTVDYPNVIFVFCNETDKRYLLRRW